MGISFDEEKNNIRQHAILDIQAADSRVSLLVIATDEEYEIVRQTLQVINNARTEIV